MEIFKIDSNPELGREEPSSWAKAFSTTTDHLERFSGLPKNSLAERELWEQNVVQSRLKEIHRILSLVRPWFNSDQAVWAWYISEPLEPFGRLTPSEVVIQYHQRGVKELEDWIRARELGAFQ